MCNPLLPISCIAELGAGAAEEAASAAGASVVDGIAEAVYAEFWRLWVEWIITPWTKINTPDLDGNTQVEWMHSRLAWLTLFVLVLSCLITAMRMIWNANGQPLKDLARSVLTTLFVSVAGLMLIDMLMRFGDQFTEWIISAAVDDGFKQKMADVTTATGPQTAGMFVLITASFGLFLAAVQAALMIFRSAVVVVMAAVLPLAAAGSGGPWGQQLFARLVGWTIAFVLYKPIAGLIYAMSIVLIGQGSDALSLVSGVALMLVAILSLGALVMLFQPNSGIFASGGGGGGMAAGMVLAAGARGARSGAAGGAMKGAAGGPKGMAVGAMSGAATGTAMSGAGAAATAGRGAGK